MQANPFIHWNQIQHVQSIPMVPSKTPLEYSRPGPSIVPMAVPGPYREATNQAATHSGIDPQKFAGQINAENGGNWSPTLPGRADPTDMGITQMNPKAIGIISGKTGPKVNFFKKNYGTEYDPTNPQHQIKGMAVYLNYLRQYGLPARGVMSPTNAQVQTGYNTMNLDSDRAHSYQSLLGSHGATSTN